MRDISQTALRIRYEAFSELGSSTNRAQSLAALGSVLAHRLKLVIDTFIFRITVVSGGSRISYQLVRDDCTIYYDCIDELSAFEQSAGATGLPRHLKAAELAAEPGLGASIFANPAITELLIMPLDQHTCLMSARKDDRSYDDLDVRFTKLIAELVATKVAQLVLVTELRHKTEELDRRNHELVRARMHANAAAAAKARFLATMSHEIRTPLSGLIGTAELLLGSQLSADQHEMASTIHSCGDTLLMLINDVLDFSKLEAHKMTLEALPFDTRECIAQTARMFSARAQAQGLVLRTEVSDDVPAPLYGDPLRLRQVISNLVGNAIKFTEAGEVVITAAREPGHADPQSQDPGRSPEQLMLRVSVRDTGIGIAADQQANIFEPFSQADSSTTRRYGGTGLGLSIATSLVERMGGRMWVDSSPGAGSTFHFTVALEAAPPVMDATVCGQGAAEPPAAATPRILVAEDNQINQRLIVRILEKLGYVADLVANGQEAVDAVSMRAYDVVLMDLQMPVMDGVEATRHIVARTEGTERRPWIVAVTASVMNEDLDELRAAGIDDCIGKPLHPERLRGLIDKWRMRRSRGAAMSDFDIP